MFIPILRAQADILRQFALSTVQHPPGVTFFILDLKEKHQILTAEKVENLFFSTAITKV